MKKITLTANLKTTSVAGLAIWNFRKLFLLAMLMVFAFGSDIMSAQVYTIDATHGGTATNPANKGKENGLCPFAKSKNKSRVQYLYQESDMDAAGMPQNQKLTHIGFNVTNLNIGVEGPKLLKNVNIKIYHLDQNKANGFVNTASVTMNTSGYVVLADVSIGDLAISSTGWVDIPLGEGQFTTMGGTFNRKNGGFKHIVVEICSDNTLDRANDNFTVSTHKTGSVSSIRSRFTTDDTNTSQPTESACSLPNASGNNNSVLTQRTNRPDIRFTYGCLTQGVGGTVTPATGGSTCLGSVVNLKVVGASDASGLLYQWQVADNSNGPYTDIAGATSASYDAKIALTDKWYNRKTACQYTAPNPVWTNAVLKGKIKAAEFKEYHNGTWLMNSTPTTAPTDGSTESILIAEGNYTIADNTSACSCMANTGSTLTIASGKTLTLTGPVADGGGTIVFQNNASLLQSTTEANTGTVIYQRDSKPMVKMDFTYWSSPVTGITLHDFSPNTRWDKYYSFNPTTQQWVQEDALTTQMVAGRGYIIRSPDSYSTTVPAVYNGNFRGIPNNGTFNAAVPAGFGSTDHYALVGNPYPSGIDANAFISDPLNAAYTNGTLYFWTHYSGASTSNAGSQTYNYNDDDYASYNYTGGVGVGEAPGSNPAGVEPGRYIGAGQSFMVVGALGSAGTIQFKNTMRVGGADNTQFYKAANGSKLADGTSTVGTAEKNRLWLEMSNATKFKRTLVGYVDGATDAIDYGYDGKAIGGTGISFYSLAGETQLGIQGKALPFNVADQVLLGFSTSIAGAHTIALYKYDGLFENQDVYLEDTTLGVIHNLKESAYTFTSEAGTFNTRFVLRYSSSSLATNEVVADANNVVVYKKQSALHINSGVSPMESVKVFDLSGRLLTSRNSIGSTDLVLDNMNWSSQVIIVQIQTEDKILVTKKVVY